MNNTACSRQCTNQRHSTAPMTISSAKAAHQQTALATPEAGARLALDPYAAARPAGVRGRTLVSPLHRCAGGAGEASAYGSAPAAANEFPDPSPGRRRRGHGMPQRGPQPQIHQHHPQPREFF